MVTARAVRSVTTLHSCCLPVASTSWSSSIRSHKLAGAFEHLRNIQRNRTYHTTSQMADQNALRATVVPSDTTLPPSSDKSHHTSKGFVNPWPSFGFPPITKLLKEMLFSRPAGHWPTVTSPPIPVHKPKFLPTRETPQLRATWLGHACYYVEFPSGLRVLFDPVFEERCSPFSFMGPKRYTPAPCQVDDISILDAVCISHNHYDHMSLPTLTAIHKKFPHAQFFAPSGNLQWFDSVTIANAHELDWWDSVTLNLDPFEAKETPSGTSTSTISGRITCTPCQHQANRSPFDRGATLWSSWAISSGGSNLYFGGDTGYRVVPDTPRDVNDYTHPDYADKYAHCPAFKQIGEHLGPFDLGLLPIGAYAPRGLFSGVHSNPYDTVNIFLDTRCKSALAMHWGTWLLTPEPVLEPPQVLREALKWKDIKEEGVFDVIDIGESREYTVTTDAAKL